ncbi:PAS domain S-box protein [Halobellus sp. Atlit-31R]|nr:PAS domain S-box protein [Halobellus sp. Atlit-31R]
MDAPVRVLHVDDEPDLGALTADFLEREDERFAVETATTASEGLDLLAASAFDCVVSDYEMPGLNGIEFLEAVRARQPDLPFVLFTGKGSEEVASEAISAGVTDYLQKGTGTEQYKLLANRLSNYVERARAQRERQRHLDAIETAQEGISILDADGEFVYVNEAYAELYRYEPEALLGEHWGLLYRQEDVQEIREEVLPTVEEEGAWEGETVGLRADGSTFVEDHSLSKTEEGSLVCTVRDVTDRREREQQLRRKTARLEVLFEQSPDMIDVHDADGTILDVNERFCEVMGESADEIVGKKVWDVDRTMDPGAVRRVLSGLDTNERVTVETQFQRTDGSAFPAEVHIRRLDIQGEDRFLVITRDVTERKAYERELREEQQFVESMLDSIPDLFYAFDTEKRLVRWNERLADAVGRSGEELDGIPLRALVPDGDVTEVSEHIRAVLEEREPARAEFTVESDEGPLTYELSASPLEDTDGTVRGITGIGRDITADKAKQREIERQNERLEAFASTISHDLRNPLTTAQGYLDLAREDGDPEHFTHVERNLDRMERIVGDLLWLAREGKQIGSTEEVDLDAAVTDAWGVVEGRADHTTIEVRDALECVEADQDRLQQLLENVLANAVEHGGDDVWVESLPSGFAVADDGTGIADADLDRVFERGYSTDDGTGIGLAIVREIADAHGWEMRLTTSERGGARFEFRT